MGVSVLPNAGAGFFAPKAETFNGTAWAEIKKRVLVTDAALLLVQETHLPESEVPSASEWLKSEVGHPYGPPQLLEFPMGHGEPVLPSWHVRILWGCCRSMGSMWLRYREWPR